MRIIRQSKRWKSGLLAASGEVKLEDEETLKKIRSDFDAMTKIRQAMVVNYYSLVAQEMDLEKLKKDTATAEAISEQNCSTWARSPLKVKRR